MAIAIHAPESANYSLHPLAGRDIAEERYYRNLIRNEKHFVYKPDVDFGFLGQVITRFCSGLWQRMHGANTINAGEAMHLLINGNYRQGHKQYFSSILNNPHYQPPIKIQGLLAQYPLTALQNAYLVETPNLADDHDIVIRETNKTWRNETNAPRTTFAYRGYTASIGHGLFPNQGTWTDPNPYRQPDPTRLSPEAYANIMQPPLYIYVKDASLFLRAI